MSSYNTAESEGLASARQILKEVPEARRTEPTRHLYDNAKYTSSDKTDVGRTIRKFRLLARIQGASA